MVLQTRDLNFSRLILPAKGSQGRDMRTYVCRPCKEYVDVDNGVALWQVLHDDREREELLNRKA